MRVIAGRHRGRRLESLPTAQVRPTSDRVREAVFNRLYSLGAVEGLVMVDAFAGTGALGIEALSRGAEHVHFIEHDRAASRAVEANLAALDLGGESSLTIGDAVTVIRRLRDIDVVLADPPYEYDQWTALLAAGDAAGASLIVAESDRRIPPEEPWREVSHRQYGRTHITVLASPRW